MNEEVKRVVDALKLPVWGEAVRVVNDRLSTAALFIENLAAENERLKSRCEAAEKDLEEMIHEQGGNLDLCHWCAGNCASGEYLCDTNGVWRGPGKEEAE